MYVLKNNEGGLRKNHIIESKDIKILLFFGDIVFFVF